MRVNKKIIWISISLLMVLSLVIASCGPKEGEEAKITEEGGQVVTTKGEEEKEEEKDIVSPGPEVPQYGGTITLANEWENNPGDLLYFGFKAHTNMCFNKIWDGDWTKGPAGGYGTNETTWGESSTNIIALKTGHIAESWRFDIDSVNKQVTTVLQIRRGIHFSLDPNNEASRLVNGRELTADDVVWCLNEFLHNPLSFHLQLYPNIKDYEAIKTGPWEVSITMPFFYHLGGIMRLFDNMVIFAPELEQEYGAARGNEGFSYWKNLVGTGPYMVQDYIPSTSSVVVRNPNYWMTDPIGPGEGNQLPYVEKVKHMIVPDLATRQAALRTGKIDRMLGFNLEDKDNMLEQCSGLNAASASSDYMGIIGMRTDQAPYNDIRVRQAMMLAIDFNTINRDLYAGLADIMSWPWWYEKAYALIHVGLDDPDCPESVKELYSYDPDKAKQLLTEAGYPNGFKTELTLLSTEADYYSIIKDYFSKVNIDMSLKIIERSAQSSVLTNRAYTLATIHEGPPATYPSHSLLTDENYLNISLIKEPSVNEVANRAKEVAIEDIYEAMKITREAEIYLLDKAYVIPSPRYPLYCLWWPWVKNYSGEQTVGYFNGDFWVQYVWVDQNLKESMGY
jgi:peptide/nickel transport system substrate-binding protein